MEAKDGTVYCKEFLSWVRRERCVACVENAVERGYSIEVVQPGCEAHHYPPKGMGGARYRDDHVVPLCRRHHEDAQAYVIPKATQARWIHETRSTFLEECSVEELRAYFDALEVWKDRPMAVPF